LCNWNHYGVIFLLERCVVALVGQFVIGNAFFLFSLSSL